MNPSARSALTLAVLLVLPQLQALCPRLAPDVISGKVIPCRYLCIKINFLELPSIVLSTERDGVLCSTLLLRRRGVCKNGGCIPFGSDDEIKPKGALGKVIAAIDKFASGSYRQKAPKQGTPFGPIVSTASSIFGGGSSKTSGSSSTSSAASSIVATATVAAVGSTFKKLLTHGASALSENKKHNEHPALHPFSSIFPSVPKPDHHPPHIPGRTVSSSPGAVEVTFGGGPPVLPPSTEGGGGNESPHVAPGTPSMSSPSPSEHPVLPSFISQSQPKPKDSLSAGSASGASSSNGNVIKHAIGLVLGNLHQISGAQTSGTPSASVAQNGPIREASGGSGTVPMEFPLGEEAAKPIAPSSTLSGTNIDGSERFPGIQASANIIQAGHPLSPPVPPTVPKIGYNPMLSTTAPSSSRSPFIESQAPGATSKAGNLAGSQVNGPYGVAMSRLKEVSQGSSLNSSPAQPSLAAFAGISEPSSASEVINLHKGTSGAEVNRNKGTVVNLPSVSATPMTADYGHGNPSVLPPTTRVFERKREEAPQWPRPPKIVSRPLNTPTRASGVPTRALQGPSQLSHRNPTRTTPPLIGNAPLRPPEMYPSESLSGSLLKISVAKPSNTLKQVPTTKTPVVSAGHPLSTVAVETSISRINLALKISHTGASNPEEKSAKESALKPTPAVAELGPNAPPIAPSTMAVVGNKGADGSQPLRTPSTILRPAVTAAEAALANLNHIRNTAFFSNKPSNRPSPSIKGSGLEAAAASVSTREASTQTEKTYGNSLNNLRQGSVSAGPTLLLQKPPLAPTAYFPKARKGSTIQNLPGATNHQEVTPPNVALTPSGVGLNATKSNSQLPTNKPVSGLLPSTGNSALVFSAASKSSSPSGDKIEKNSGGALGTLLQNSKGSLSLILPKKLSLIPVSVKVKQISLNKSITVPQKGHTYVEKTVTQHVRASTVPAAIADMTPIKRGFARISQNPVAAASRPSSALVGTAQPSISRPEALRQLSRSIPSNTPSLSTTATTPVGPSASQNQHSRESPQFKPSKTGVTFTPKQQPSEANAGKSKQNNFISSNSHHAAKVTTIEPRNSRPGALSQLSSSTIAAETVNVVPATPSVIPGLLQNPRSNLPAQGITHSPKEQQLEAVAGTTKHSFASLVHGSHRSTKPATTETSVSTIRSPLLLPQAAVRSRSPLLSGIDHAGKNSVSPTLAPTKNTVPAELDGTKNAIPPGLPQKTAHLNKGKLNSGSTPEQPSLPATKKSSAGNSSGSGSLASHARPKKRFFGRFFSRFKHKMKQNRHKSQSMHNDIVKGGVASPPRDLDSTKLKIGTLSKSGVKGSTLPGQPAAVPQSKPKSLPPPSQRKILPISPTRTEIQTTKFTNVESTIPNKGTTIALPKTEGELLSKTKSAISTPKNKASPEVTPARRSSHGGVKTTVIDWKNSLSTKGGPVNLTNNVPLTSEFGAASGLISNRPSTTQIGQITSRVHSAEVQETKGLSPAEHNDKKAPPTIPSATVTTQRNTNRKVVESVNKSTIPTLPTRTSGTREATRNAVSPIGMVPSMRPLQPSSASSATITGMKIASPSISSTSHVNAAVTTSMPTASTGAPSSAHSVNQLPPKPIAAQQSPAPAIAAASKGRNASYGRNQGSQTSGTIQKTTNNHSTGENVNVKSGTLLQSSQGTSGRVGSKILPRTDNLSKAISVSTAKSNNDTSRDSERSTVTSAALQASTSAMVSATLGGRIVGTNEAHTPTPDSLSITKGSIPVRPGAPLAPNPTLVPAGSVIPSASSVQGAITSNIAPSTLGSAGTSEAHTPTLGSVSITKGSVSLRPGAQPAPNPRLVSAGSETPLASSAQSAFAVNRLAGTLGTAGTGDAQNLTLGSVSISKGSVSVRPVAHPGPNPTLVSAGSMAPLASSVQGDITENRPTGTGRTYGTSQTLTPMLGSHSITKGSVSVRPGAPPAPNPTLVSAGSGAPLASSVQSGFAVNQLAGTLGTAGTGDAQNPTLGSVSITKGSVSVTLGAQPASNPTLVSAGSMAPLASSVQGVITEHRPAGTARTAGTWQTLTPTLGSLSITKGSVSVRPGAPPASNPTLVSAVSGAPFASSVQGTTTSNRPPGTLGSAGTSEAHTPTLGSVPITKGSVSVKPGAHSATNSTLASSGSRVPLASSIQSAIAGNRPAGTLGIAGTRQTLTPTLASFSITKGSVSVRPVAHIGPNPTLVSAGLGAPSASSVGGAIASNRPEGTSGTTKTSKAHTPMAGSFSGTKGSASLGRAEGVETLMPLPPKSTNIEDNLPGSSTSGAQIGLVPKTASSLAAPNVHNPSTTFSSTANVPATPAASTTDSRSPLSKTLLNELKKAKKAATPGSPSDLAASLPMRSAPQNVHAPKLLVATTVKKGVKNILYAVPRLRSSALLQKENASNNAKSPGGSASSLKKAGINSENNTASTAFPPRGEPISTGPITPKEDLKLDSRSLKVIKKLGGLFSSRMDAFRSSVQPGSSALPNLQLIRAPNKGVSGATEAKSTTAIPAFTQPVAPEKPSTPSMYVPPANAPTTVVNNGEQQDSPMYPGMQTPGGMVFGRQMPQGFWGPPQGMPGMYRPF